MSPARGSGRPIKERIEEDVVVTPSGCWVYPGKGGPYGHVMVTSRHPDMNDGTKTTTGAHRWSWMLANGPIPEGLVVRHHCDNPPCVNPDHLAAGTQKQNIHDAIDRGRYRFVVGEENGKSKLTENAVREIRRERAIGVGTTALARRFGVHPEVIRKVVSREAWRHVA